MKHGSVQIENAATRRLPVVPTLVFALLSVGIAGVGCWWYWRSKANLRQIATQQLDTIARLKADRITAELGLRRSRAVNVANNPLITEPIARWLTEPTWAEGRRDLQDWLASLVKYEGYERAALTDPQGRVLLTTAPELPLAAAADPAAGARPAGPVLSSPYPSSADAPRRLLDLTVGVGPPRAARQTAGAFLVLTLNAEPLLAPILQSAWTATEADVEAYVVRRQGADVTFLTGRYSPLVRRPAASPRLPGALALRGVTEAVEGDDYQGQPVLAAVQPIAETDWFLVAEAKRTALYAPLYAQAIRVAVLVAGLILIVGLLLWLWWKGRAADFYRRQLASERERQAMSQRHAYLLQHANDSILLTDAQQHIVEANDRAGRDYACAPADLAGVPMADLMAPAARAESAEILAQASAADRWRYESRHRRRDGSEFPVEVSAGRLEIAGEVCYQFIVRDVTERQRAARETQALNRELAHIGRVASLGELTASLAHELNQPLAAIRNNAEAARRLLATERLDAAAFAEILADIVADDERAGKVLGQVRALLRKEAPATQALPMKETIREVVALVRQEAQTNHIAVELELAKDLPVVRGDRVQLQQVMLNLLLNAIEAMREGGTTPRRLVVRAQRSEPALVEVLVSDTGPGLPTARLDHIFEPFYTTKTAGLGMGLAICRRIVDAHGGRIWATNNAGGGATVRFVLPSLGGPNS